MTGHSKFLQTKYFSSLNGLRCLAIIFVIGFHFNSSAIVLGMPNFSFHSLFDRGYIGVHLFFVISGFLITTLLLREQQLREKISIRAFYIRRILRIFPLYYATLIFYIIWVPLSEAPQDTKKDFFYNLPFFMTFTGNWFVDSAAFFGFSWSLATEEQFYFL